VVVINSLSSSIKNNTKREKMKTRKTRKPRDVLVINSLSGGYQFTVFWWWMVVVINSMSFSIENK